MWSNATSLNARGSRGLFNIINMRAAKPFIGIPADRRLLGKHWFHAVGEKYIEAVVAAADAIPVLIPALGDGAGPRRACCSVSTACC